MQRVSEFKIEFSWMKNRNSLKEIYCDAMTDNAELKQVILAVLATQPAIRLALLFGSLAVGKGRADSDIDLAVDAGRRLTTDEKIQLIAALAEKTGRPVDLVDIRTIGEPLLGQVLKQGKKILGSDTHYAELIRRHVFDQADFLPYRNRILVHRRQLWIGK